jgi:HPt (histidine-containing phosphotransfer) domain-containing protein
MPDATAREASPRPILDLVHLARQSGGDRELEQELLALFAGQCERLLGLIRSGSPAQGRDAAHTLKGAARAVGAWQVADAAEAVEAELAAGRQSAALPHLADAASAARGVIADLRHAA